MIMNVMENEQKIYVRIKAKDDYSFYNKSISIFVDGKKFTFFPMI